MAEREERKRALLKQTLFYKGEADCPEVIGRGCTYWDYERVWVKWELEQDEEYIRLLTYFLTQIQKDQPVYSSVPIGLQAIFYSRIAHWNGGREPVTLEDVHQFCQKYEQTFTELHNQ